MVDYIGIDGVQKILARVGTAEFIAGLAQEIEADYRRWHEFDKSARHAIHSQEGVIELMPTSDGKLYSFKFVNGHPKNTAAGLLTVTAFGVLADVATVVRALSRSSAINCRSVSSISCPDKTPSITGDSHNIRPIMINILAIRCLRLCAKSGDLRPRALQ